MPKNVNIMKVYDKILTVKEMLSEVVNVSMETANEAESFGGEVSRVLTSQLRQQLIPSIQKFVDDKDNPASISSLITFLDRVPLAWIRSGQDEPNQQAPMSDMMPSQVGLAPTTPVPNTVPSTPPNAGVANPNAEVEEEPETMKLAASTILKDKNKLRESLISDWENAQQAKAPASGSLSFNSLREDYKKMPPLVPGLLSGAVEEEGRVFANALKEAASPSKTKLEEKDIICGPYAVREDVEGMGDWKSLVDDEGSIEAMLQG